LEDVEELLLVTAWFRRYPQERSRTLDPAKALDGKIRSI